MQSYIKESHELPGRKHSLPKISMWTLNTSILHSAVLNKEKIKVSNILACEYNQCFCNIMKEIEIFSIL